MNNKSNVDFGALDGQTYIIGREGHIYISSPTVSKHHAAIKIKNGRVYLRDLNSTNGTYLIKNNNLVYFEEGYVNPLQLIMMGKVKCTVQSLLAIAGVNAAAKNTTSDPEDTTKLVIPVNDPLKRHG